MSTRALVRRQLVGVVLGAVLVGPRPALAQHVDEIIAKHIEARGGMAALEAVKSAHISGVLRIDGGKHECTIQWKRPGKYRMDYTRQGMTNVQAFDGESGWVINAFGHDPSPFPMSAGQLQRIKERADFIEGALVHYREKGHTVDLEGVEDVDGAKAYKLKLTRAGGAVEYLYVDAEHYLVSKREAKITIHNGRRIDAVAWMSSYKRVGGVLVAHTIDTTLGRNHSDLGGAHGAKQSIQIDSVEFNVPIDDQLFTLSKPSEHP